MMKVLYVAMQYDYGDPKRGMSFEEENFYGSFKNMGYELTRFDFMQRIKEVGYVQMNKDLRTLALDSRPDILFCVLFQEQLDKSVITEISKSGKTITMNWYCDDHWRFDSYSKYWAPCFNWNLTTDQESVIKYNKSGIQNVILTQWACNHFLYKPISGNYEYEVTFIGQPHGTRKKVIQAIRNAGINVQVWGNGWDLGRVSQEEMIRIFSQSKINLNLSNASVRQKNRLKFWQKGFDQIKGRNFEVPGCGGFLLTSMVSGLDNYFIPEKEIGVYHNTKDLIKHIDYYLAHDQERKEIAQRGYIRTITEHTYEIRFKEIFKKIGLN